MEISLGKVQVIYPHEDSPTEREFKIRVEGDLLFVDFIDSQLDSGSFYMTKNQVALLADSLNLILKNNRIEG